MQFYRLWTLVVASICGILTVALDAGRSKALAGATPEATVRRDAHAFATLDPFPVRASSMIPPDYTSYVDAASAEHGVSRELIHAIVQAESGFDPLALSSRGACGLMQLMPRTARSLGVIDCFDPRQNIRAGTRYLKLLMTRYDGSLVMSIAAYHAGESAVARHRGVPPYRDTRAYVRKVTALLLTGSEGRVTRTDVSRESRRNGAVG